jgi:hypothetical protein
MEILDICNMALANVPHAPIEALDQENNVAAYYCNLFYETARKDALQAHFWTFAGAEEELELDESYEPGRWRFSYELPEDFLQIRHLRGTGASGGLISWFSEGGLVYLSPSARKFPYEVVGANILTDYAEATMAYTFDADDPEDFSSAFAELMSLGLAYRVSMPITGKPAIRERLRAEYEMALVRASGRDGKQSLLPFSQSTELLEARR